MTDNGSPAGDQTNRAGTIDYFRRLPVLHNHWARPRRRPSYYWYLTFQDATALHSLARTCQAAISFPYYDLIPADRLHMTLDRIASIDEVTDGQLEAIARSAAHAHERVPPFDISVGSLGGTRGAVGFNAQPIDRLRHLRDVLAEISQRVLHVARPSDAEFHPHVSIAYCNRNDVPAGQAIAAVEALNLLPPAATTITEATMVLLERRERSYAWQTVSRISLAG